MGFKESELIRARELYYKTITDIKTEIEDIPLIVAEGYSPGRMQETHMYTCRRDTAGHQIRHHKECDAKEAISRIYKLQRRRYYNNHESPGCSMQGSGK